MLMKRGIIGEIYNIAANFEIAIIQLARDLVKMVISLVRFYMAALLSAFFLFYINSTYIVYMH